MANSRYTCRAVRVIYLSISLFTAGTSHEWAGVQPAAANLRRRCGLERAAKGGVLIVSQKSAQEVSVAGGVERLVGT